MLHYSEPQHVSTIGFSGADAASFLHGQLTCDVTALANNRSTYGGYCTPKGRLLATFLMWRSSERFFLQLPSSLRESIQKRLSMYVLRAKVKVEDASSRWTIAGLSGAGAALRVEQALGAVPQHDHEVIEARDSTAIRLPGDRFEILLSGQDMPATIDRLKSGTAVMDPTYWDWLAIRAGAATITPPTQEQFTPQMVNLDLIEGLSFSKGCYPGQEIVARTHFLGRLKQRTYLARLTGAERPQPGDKLYSPDLGGQASGMVVNEARSPEGGYDVLAAIQIASVQGSSVHWKSLDGPRLDLLPLPYEVSAVA